MRQQQCHRRERVLGPRVALDEGVLQVPDEQVPEHEQDPVRLLQGEARRRLRGVRAEARGIVGIALPPCKLRLVPTKDDLSFFVSTLFKYNLTIYK